jgi:hypothetical protein
MTHIGDTAREVFMVDPQLLNGFTSAGTAERDAQNLAVYSFGQLRPDYPRDKVGTAFQAGPRALADALKALGPMDKNHPGKLNEFITVLAGKLGIDPVDMAPRDGYRLKRLRRTRSTGDRDLATIANLREAINSIDEADIRPSVEGSKEPLQYLRSTLLCLAARAVLTDLLDSQIAELLKQGKTTFGSKVRHSARLLEADDKIIDTLVGAIARKVTVDSGQLAQRIRALVGQCLKRNRPRSTGASAN